MSRRPGSKYGKLLRGGVAKFADEGTTTWLMLQVPATIETSPTSHAPDAKAQQAMSTAPVATGVPCNSPVNIAASSLTTPATDSLGMISGSFPIQLSREVRRRRSVAYRPVFMSNIPAVAASVGSVATTPVRRMRRKSLHHRILSARASI